MRRWVARVRTVVNPTLHYEGAPPQSVDNNDEDERIVMADAAWVVMEINRDGVFLLRYSEEREFAGDTWTPNRELALEVAASEYGLTQDEWIPVPDSVADPIAFVLDTDPGKVDHSGPERA